MSSSIPPSQAPTTDRQLELEHVTVVERPHLRKAIIGAMVGNGMEWYDFGIYGYLTATMTTVFVPNIAPKWQLLVVLAGFAVSFLARPIGGFYFGPLGDRIGRQRVLAITMILMSVATAAIGLLPSAHTIGYWALVLLMLCRMVQGFSTGGEYAGATTFVSEFSPDKQRGYFSSILDVGSYLGFACGAATVALVTAIVGNSAMHSWGWRLPFLVAIPLGLISLYFRLKIGESPTFEQSQAMSEALANAAGEEDHVPQGILGTVKVYWRQILIAMALVAATQTAGYSLTSYMPSYLESNHGYSTIQSALATIPVLVLLSVAIPFVGAWSDKIGRKPIYAMAIIATLVLTIPAFLMMGNHTLVYLAMFLLSIGVVFYVSISASSLPALFPTASRYGAMAIAFNLSVSLFGGTAPMFSELLVKLTGLSYAPAFYTMFFALVGAVAMKFMPESARKPMPGSMPTVASLEEAHDLVETQHENPDIVHDELPFEEFDAAQELLAEQASSADHA